MLRTPMTNQVNQSATAEVQAVIESPKVFGLHLPLVVGIYPVRCDGDLPDGWAPAVARATERAMRMRAQGLRGEINEREIEEYARRIGVAR